MFLRILVQTNEIKGFGGRLWQEVLHVRELRVRPAQALRQGPSKGTTKHYQSLSLSDLVMTSNMIWGKTPPPLCDFVQWLDTEQSQQDKDHVERQARWAAQRWQRMLHEEQMEEKRKKNQEEIQKRIAEVERQKAEEREADRERKRERARRAKEAGSEAIRKGKYPRCTQ